MRGAEEGLDERGRGVRDEYGQEYKEYKDGQWQETEMQEKMR